MIDVRQDYRTLVDIGWTVFEARSEKLTPETAWLYDSQRISQKLLYHLETAWLIANGTPWPAHTTPGGMGRASFVDFASLAVVLRAAFETYLTLHHLFVDRLASEALRRFRHRMWELGGLRDRQGYRVSLPEHREKLARERMRIEELRREITVDEAYKHLDETEQRQALKGQWRLKLTWQNIAVAADQHGGFFAQTYRHLCGHSHTSYISALQVSQAGHHDQELYMRALLGIGCRIASNFVKHYATLSERVASALPPDHDRRRAVLERWDFTAENVERWWLSDQGVK